MLLGVGEAGDYQVKPLTIKNMDKTKFHLGQVLTYDGQKAIVDALTQSMIALRVGGQYIVEDWDNLPMLVSHVGA